MPLREKLESWKKQLLDLGKRNRLINFKETKRSNITITNPGFDKVYQSIVLNEKPLKFPFAKKIRFDENGEEIVDIVVNGDFETNKTLTELQKTLKALRLKAKTSIEEQGINTLYLTFGMIKWTEVDYSTQFLTSPIILVPVSLTIESISSPFVLQLHEDEIVINPTLAYKFENDFGIKFPDFDALETNIEYYFQRITELVEDKSWEVLPIVNLSTLSFLKINMYKDLDRNEERIANNPIIAAIAGSYDIISLPEEFNNFDHDAQVRPIDTYQVVDADSSQQDAILLAKNGISFVLQGPPGTGKSQTITNIISEALADGKKVLFVSEKMAALQVVHKRLTQVELNDFCLTLHSHKANKKEVLRQLEKTINLERKKVRDEAIYKLNELQFTRDKLNKYHTELHTICQPLNKTIFEVNGKLASLTYIPEIVFTIENVDKITEQRLKQLVYLLNELSKTIGRMSSDYTENPWYNSNVKMVTHELRHDIEAKGKILIKQIKDIAQFSEIVSESFDLSTPETFENIDNLIEILQLAGKSPKLPIEWIANEDIDSLIKLAGEYLRIINEYQILKDRISLNYNLSIFTLNGGELRKKIKLNAGNLKEIVNEKSFGSESIVVLSIEDIERSCDQVYSILKEITDVCIKTAFVLGTETPETIETIENFKLLLNLLIQNPLPTEAWFTNPENEIVDLFNKTKETHIEYHKSTEKIKTHYENEILEIDTDSILKRFRTEYNSIFKYFKANYKADKKLILSFTRNSDKKDNDSDIIDLLNSLKHINDKKEWITSNENQIQIFFGEYYKGGQTDWDKLFLSIKTFFLISNSFRSRNLPIQLEKLLLSKSLDLDELKYSISILDKLDLDIFNQLELLLRNIYNQSKPKELIEVLKAIKSYVGSIRKEYYGFIQLANTSVDYETVLSDLSVLERIQFISGEIDAQKVTLETQFSFLFKGIETDWNQILNALSFAADFKLLITTYKLPDSFVKAICEDEKYISKVKESGRILFEKRNELTSDFDWFINLFEKTEKIREQNLYKIADRIETCLNNISLLEEWIDFRSTRESCRNNGLSQYIGQIEQLKIDAGLISNIFLKRFYRLWLDIAISDFTAISSFRRKSFDNTINEFRELDKYQLSLARLRVKEKLLNNLPDFNSATAARDEIGILRRELNKQRRILPLRKLFNLIPNLLTSLKPCLMMSPLSVSVFLEASSYNFDMVIFDEASQVCTEDAIGAIMRGKQVIIVGDSKQLPPTNFFATTVSNDDFDTENEDENDDVGSYESILDEALKAIPERSLKWHYRSRHESLIAFSNSKIYNYNLITFPANIDKAKDYGVEYVYVENGIYERGGKNHNINEAKKVAELVFEHIKKQPKRSVGVVTFSEAQQQAVDNAIRQLRINSPQFEYFFSEDKDDAFFIKNLENVQGDERDTIIFSIGYAKDANGVMYMNFGPLNRDGGYRRLNVAITRAKFNIKLVGSIYPTDINLEKTNSEGVKMLRSYIDYAINGTSTLLNEIKFNESIDLESPFEESIYDFLVSKGYKVKTQVGCSGYRIDMAVVHPNLPGIFVLGVECDGATYHCTRTARERDRLRQTVLEDIGWKIFRVWSTDWVKDPRSEGEKLILAVEKALADYMEPKLFEQAIEENPIAPKASEEKVFETVEDLLNKTYNFVEYEEANIYEIAISKDTTAYLKEVFKYVIGLEYPIHYENLSKRLTPILGVQKATSSIQGKILWFVENHLKNEIIKVDEFFYAPANYDEIIVRIPKPGDKVRPINYISTTEIAEAMYCVASKCYGIKAEDLFVATSREFGFNRTGSNITNSMQIAYNYLFKSERIQEDDEGKVIVII